MGSWRVLTFIFLCFFNWKSIEASRIKITNNGYEDILVSLPADTPRVDRARVVASLQEVFRQSSELLYTGTRGRAFFRSVAFLVPAVWGGENAWLPKGLKNVTSFENAPPAFSREGADVIVTHVGGGDLPYVLHHRGCGYRARRIRLPVGFLLDGTEEKGKVFVNLWSEFRYGIFPEKGFEGDKKYPTVYQIPGDPENRTTDCNLDFFRQTNAGRDVENSPSNNMNSPTFTPREGLYCEGYLTLGRNHNPEAPSKHNLLCDEQGTWFVVRKSPDFLSGKNAARRHSNREMNFRFFREVSTPKVLVAIEISARMRHEERYSMVQNAFSHFVTSLLPDQSELTLAVFGGGDSGGGLSVLTSAETLRDEAARITYLEGLPLPDETSAVEDVCLDCVLGELFEMLSNRSSTAEIIVITSQSGIAASRREDLRQAIELSESRLHVISFMEDHPDASYPTASVHDLCLETKADFVGLESDPFGVLYRAFGDVMRGTNAKEMVLQEYLPLQDDEDIEITFTADRGLSSDLRVSLSGPTFNTPLAYASTSLTTPTGRVILPKKQEWVPSWLFLDKTPEVGKYTLKTRRKFDETKPILLSVTSSTSENSVTAKVWVEILDSEAVPSPIQIFAEIKQGHNPVRNANVVAHIQHPGTDGTSVITLMDDGQGNIDVTEGDGIYSYIYTNFTSIGFYNVYVKAFGTENTEVLKGPSSPCCGSSFSYQQASVTGAFQREAGPATFHVKTLPSSDHYPPSQVTDLRISKIYDEKIVVLQWTAVGDDFGSGVASWYEVKLFDDRFLLRHHFDNPMHAVWSDDRIPTTPVAVVGKRLVHQVLLPSPLPWTGVHYFGVRAVDEAGNAGKPSNAVPIWLRQTNQPFTCENGEAIVE